MKWNNPLLNRAFREPISRDRAKDAGMAVVLILLILDFFLDHVNLLPFAVGALVLNMVAPGIYNFFAIFWFLLAELLGTLMSKVLLTIIFGIVVLPVGILYRLFGKDSLKLNQFKKGKGSVFRDRCHQFQPEDIKHPY